MKLFPDGRVITGWYYIEANKFYLCRTGDDCEVVIFKDSKVSKLFLWRIRISNKYVNKVIFLGPFAWSNCFSVFDKGLGK